MNIKSRGSLATWRRETKKSSRTDWANLVLRTYRAVARGVRLVTGGWSVMDLMAKLSRLPPSVYKVQLTVVIYYVVLLRAQESDIE